MELVRLTVGLECYKRKQKSYDAIFHSMVVKYVEKVLRNSAIEKYSKQIVNSLICKHIIIFLQIGIKTVLLI